VYFTMRDAPAFQDRVPWPELMAASEPLAESFFARDTVTVARELLGKVLIHRCRAGLIVEVEAYLGVDDLAAHASRGRTARTSVLFGPPGRAYVYLIYGIHECLNLVVEPDGKPGCVLLRALEPLCGLAEMKEARLRAMRPEELASGPGNLTRAMGITRRHYGADVTREGSPLGVRAWKGAPDIVTGASPRVGIRQCADWPLRFFVRGNCAVSGPARWR
jgi:DNA-3-methyladenine glycosylase